MPDMIRATGIGYSDRRGGFALRLAALVTLSIITLSMPAGSAGAQDGNPRAPGIAFIDAVRALDEHQLASLALFFGVLAFAVVTAIMLVRTRERLRVERARARAEVASLDGEIDRLYGLLLAEPQVIVAWNRGAAPQIIGDPSAIAPDLTADRIMTYAAWLRPEQAFVLDSAVERLLSRGEGFSASLTTATGRYITAEGRAIGGSAVLRLNDVSGPKKEVAELAHRLQKQQADAEAQQALINALPSPAWMRDAAGNLTLVNPAFAGAVEAPDPASAVAGGRELLDSGTRDEIARCRAGGTTYTGRAAVIVAGARRIFEIFETPAPRGSAGIGRDVTDLETLRADIARTVESHRRTLNQLSTGVAIFGPDHNLAFYNAAYRALWEIDAGFLDQSPSDSAVLDRLRAARRLPEQQDFRVWKAQLHQAYRASEPAKYEWHLPDQRTLRVVTTPNPDGGVTYLFDDVTERLNLERRFDALIRVQGETLDNLTEAVALFGSDGRVRLFNPAFEKMWQLSPAMLAEHPHIETVIAQCRTFHRDEETWQILHAAVTAIDSREPLFRRIERTDGGVVDCRTVRLPDGATLVTFQDVTDSVNVERVLIERNEALVEADKIKIDFVHHVSYELRSPLTNIIGFAHFLGDSSTGPLTAKQAEYLGYITVSSNALLAIINNILDLASIGAGAMTLEMERVDIRAAMDAAAEGVQDRLVKSSIRLELRAAPDIGSFVADEPRVRQILFNLLSNAVGFSPAGETVVLAAERTPEEVVFTVSDHGPGISNDIKDKVFDWFESDTRGTHHRGVGLGLSIVRSFVELHHGSVRIDSVPGQGTTVVCTFPLAAETAQDAAE
jgi:signal transduction histidine kinase